MLPATAALDDWIAREAVPFDLDGPSFDAAVDQMLAGFEPDLALLGLGETMHGGVDLLRLRNRLFQRLVEAHGFSAIALESSLPRGRVVNDYVLGRGPEAYEAVQDAGFSHGFGRLATTRALVEWIRAYNTGQPPDRQVRFYGFDSPAEMMHTDSPRQALSFALDYLAGLHPTGAAARRERIEALLGPDAAWENPNANLDATQSIGLSDAAQALRLETEELLAELQLRRPEPAALTDPGAYLEAVQHAVLARQLLTYHAAVARTSDDRLPRLLGLRDALMADNLAYCVARERGRGKVLAFAHNSHLQRGPARWQLGPHALQWWPAGAHVSAMFGPAYAVIGTAVGASEAHALPPPERGTLEARLTTAPGPGRLIPTRTARELPPEALAAVPQRAIGPNRFSYFALTPQSLSDFDWLAVLDTTA